MTEKTVQKTYTIRYSGLYCDEKCEALAYGSCSYCLVYGKTMLKRNHKREDIDFDNIFRCDKCFDTNGEL